MIRIPASSNYRVDIAKKERFVSSSLIVVLMALFLRPVIWYLELNSVIPPSNFTSWLSALLVLCLTIQMIYGDKLCLTRIDLLTLVFLIICLLIVSYNFFTHGMIYDYAGSSYSTYVTLVILQSVIYFLVGRFFLVPALNKPAALRLSWLLVCLFYLLNYSGEYGGLDLSGIDYKLRGIFLSLADMFALSCFIVITSQKKQTVQVYVFLFSLLILFFLHSRSSLLAFFISGAIFFVRRNAKGNIVFWFTMLVPPLVILLIYFADTIFLANQRMLGFFLNPLADSSLLTRLEQIKIGLSDIYSSPFVGVYGGQIKKFGGIGWYIHNILSYWRQFGLIPFLLVLVLFFFIPLRLLKLQMQLRSKEFDLLFLVFAFSAISVLSSRAFEWYFCWLMVGMTAALVRLPPIISANPDE
ncbi:hypothetical protein [Endozoicomonas sp. YOMI1]|uniref:hypothetical protein n=1 Tax=Endozoicomonas sp. YOMI1 TaxID=2828739 RepID=UPI002148F69B|nr:hypothetical protein [Endozoicomonas sp. YOMI1]